MISTMEHEVKEGKDDMKKRPLLRLKRWNATRWLSRSACLRAICKSYEHILEHLTEFITSSDETASNKRTAIELYDRLTSYDTFLFIFLYNELAWTLSRYSMRLQLKDIQIRMVGRSIMSLCSRLQVNYSRESLVPIQMLGTGTSDVIMNELWGEDLNCKSRINLADMSGILERENALQSATSASFNPQTSERRTRGVNVSSSYLDVLSRKVREEREKEIQAELAESQHEPEVSAVEVLG
jgi:hypothetical protein